MDHPIEPMILYYVLMCVVCMDCFSYVCQFYILLSCTIRQSNADLDAPLSSKWRKKWIVDIEAMKNHPFIDDFASYDPSIFIYGGCSIAMFDYRRLCWFSTKHQQPTVHNSWETSPTKAGATGMGSNPIFLTVLSRG